MIFIGGKENLNFAHHLSIFFPFFSFMRLDFCCSSQMCALKGKPVQVPSSVTHMSEKAKAAKDKKAIPGLPLPAQESPVGKIL